MKSVLKYKRFLVALILVVTCISLTAGCSLLPVKDSVQNFTKGYLGKVLSESLKKSKEDFPGEDEDTKLKSEKYLKSEFGKYFTEIGYKRFESDKIFINKTQYFRENNIQEILNIIITVNVSEGSDEKEDITRYDYTIEYYAINSDNKSEKIIDSGVLEVIKESAGNYVIDSDEIKISN